MMKYFELHMEGEERWHLRLLSIEPQVDIWACKLAASSEPISFEVQVDGARMDYNPSSFALPVVSAKVSNVLQAIAPNDIQFIPAKVVGDLGQWYVLNIVVCVDCIDHDRSLIQYYPSHHPSKAGKPRGVVRLILDPGRIGEHHILRPQGWEIALIVSETVREALHSIQATGIEFIPVTQ